jgi:DNA repair protein RadA/Sms
MTIRIKIQDGFEWGTTLQDIEVPDALRQKISSGLDFFDAATGGEGFTPSAVTLFTGEAGAGKTTMTMMLADALSRNGNTVVFNTAEESLLQVKMTADRLRLLGNFKVGSETHVPTLLKKCDALRAKNPGKPFFLIVDSLQCMDDGHYPDGQINSKSSERVLTQITDWAKANLTNPVVIGQVTKGGQFQGSNTLKHMVDSMIHLYVERKDPDLAGARILETTKNRFGSSGCKQIMAITDSGFKMIGQTM